MAVYTHLSDDEITTYVGEFAVGRVLTCQGISQGTINTLYDVHTNRGRYVLRLLEDRPLSDAEFESALVNHLAAKGLPVPTMIATPDGVRVISMNSRQHFSLFEFLDGRELAPGEPDCGSVAQIGAFLGAMHVAVADLSIERANPFSPSSVQDVISSSLKSERGEQDRALLTRLAALVAAAPSEETLSQGVIHGDLFIDNTRFEGRDLCAVFDFEMASSGTFLFDVAVALDDWAFSPPYTSFSTELGRALIDGYRKERALTEAECSGLYDMCCFVAARYTASRFYDFEVRARPDAERLHKDYREFLSRIEALEALGRSRFEAALFG